MINIIMFHLLWDRLTRTSKTPRMKALWRLERGQEPVGWGIYYSSKLPVA